jgi:hypothetical protein
MGFSPGDVRGHIVSQKNDHGASYWRYRVLQRRCGLRISFCEIFSGARFSTFATLSIRKRTLSDRLSMSILCRQKRTRSIPQRENSISRHGGEPPGSIAAALQLGFAVSRSPTAESLAQLSDILGLDCRRSISPRIAHICEDVRNLGVIEIPTEGGHGGRGRRS